MVSVAAADATAPLIEMEAVVAFVSVAAKRFPTIADAADQYPPVNTACFAAPLIVVNGRPVITAAPTPLPLLDKVKFIVTKTSVPILM